MKRVLLLMTTTSYRAQAFLQAAESLELEVVVGSDREQALAFANPSAHLTLDFASPEISALRATEFAYENPVDAVVAADDDGVLVAAHIARVLGLRHASPEAVAAARSKRLFRDRLASAGVPGPRYFELGIDAYPVEAARQATYPCVLKPLALSASRGVIRVDDEASFLEAFRRIASLLSRVEAPGASERRGILVEEYLPGSEVALEGILTGGQLRTLALFDKPDPLEGPYFEETIYVTPSRFPLPVREAIVEQTAKAAAALGLDHGPIHAEMRINELGVWMLEIAPRSIGGLCSRALRFTDGATLESLILRHALGEDITTIEREPSASGVMMIPIPQPGVLRAVEGVERAGRVPGIEDVIISIPNGQRLVPLPEGARYLGFIFARGERPSDVEESLRQAHALLSFVIESDDAAQPDPGLPCGRQGA
ncbi:MAG TPA: ATP-grasp domain-containing protein [Candidatus Eisenbacteria bacterium]|nr:ATP-grasp domain-containing protein [Candidatus Eisenbacteria bacterium]